MVEQTENQPDNMNTSSGKNSMNGNGAVAKGDNTIALGENAVMVNGDMIGNINNGLSIEELITALKHAFPKNDTRPERYEKALKEFSKYHLTLAEWKAVHDYLDQIIVSFGPFSREIQRANSNKKILYPEDLRYSWLAVSLKVDTLLEFSQTIQYIGKKYQNLGDRFVGEEWAVKIGESRNRINAQIGLDQSSMFDESIHHRVNILEQGKNLIGIKPIWWVRLYEASNQFDHLVSLQMSTVDKRLLETATNLQQHSKSLFGS